MGENTPMTDRQGKHNPILLRRDDYFVAIQGCTCGWKSNLQSHVDTDEQFTFHVATESLLSKQ